MAKPVNFPTSRVEALESFNSHVPRMKWRRASKGSPIPTGSRISKYGLTPDEKLQQYAPEGTAPERMIFGWLVRHNILFSFQESVLGGRAVPGGAVLDFVIYEKFPAIVIRVMSYWHDSAAQQMHDAIQQEALLEMGYVVEDVWEREVNTVARVDSKMADILYGAPGWH